MSEVVPGVNMYQAMIESFNNAVRGLAPLEYPAAASLATATAIDMIQSALGTAASVPVSDTR